MSKPLPALKEILRNARKLIAEQDYSVRDAVYGSAVNGESEAAAITLLHEEGLFRGPVMAKQDVLDVFDRLIEA